MLDYERPVERGEGGEVGRAREDAELERVEKERRRDDEVEERLDDERRRQRGIGRVPDAALRQVELDEVTGPGGRDRVDADSRQIGAEHAPVGDALTRVRGPQDVLPAAHPQGELDDVEEDPEEERAPADGCERAEEGLGGIEKRADVVHASDDSSV